MKMITIGISLGTRSIGIAVLKDNELLDWKLKSFPDYWSKSKCSLIIGTLRKVIDQYEPQRIAIKTPAEAQQSKQLRELLSLLVKIVNSKQLPLYSYTLSDLKQCFGCSSKEILILTLTNHFPELAHTYKKVVRYKNGYYNKTFEAVAVAMLCAAISQK